MEGRKGKISKGREINLNDDNWRFVKFIYLKEQKDLSVSLIIPTINIFQIYKHYLNRFS
jgi:hypothetical protein